MRTIRLCFVVFGITSSPVIHTIHGRPWLCIARNRAWSYSNCTQLRTTVTVTAYSAWRQLGPPIPAVNKNAPAKCDIQTTVQQLPIAKPDIRWESTFSPTPPLYSTLPLGGGVPSVYRHDVLCGKTRIVWLPDDEKMFICFDRIHERDRQTDGQTDRQTPHDG